MIEITVRENPAEVWVTLRGNQSASWLDNKRYLVLQIGLSVFFCLPFIMLGYWVILCFIVVFYFFLIACVWLVARSTARVEQIRITESTIAYSPLLARSKSPQFTQCFSRENVKFDLLKVGSRWYADKLIMRVPDGQIIIGETLSQLECKALKERLCGYVEGDFQKLEPSSTTISIPTIDEYSFFSN